MVDLTMQIRAEVSQHWKRKTMANNNKTDIMKTVSKNNYKKKNEK